MLPGAVYASALVNNESNIAFSWKDNTGTGTARQDDKLVMVAFLPQRNEVYASIGDAARQDGKAILKTSAYKGYTVETWMSFISADEINAADSVYTGPLVL